MRNPKNMLIVGIVLLVVGDCTTGGRGLYPAV